MLSVVALFGIELALLLAVDGGLVYGKFHRTINVLAGPHIALLKQKLAELGAKIPRASQAKADVKKTE